MSCSVESSHRKHSCEVTLDEFTVKFSREPVRSTNLVAEITVQLFVLSG